MVHTLFSFVSSFGLYFVLVEQEDERDWYWDGPGQELHLLRQDQHGHHHEADSRRPLGPQRYGGKHNSRNKFYKK